jgi:2-isopropylmalate synthase
LEGEQALNDAFARFKALADRKTEIFDEDLHAIVSGEQEPSAERYRLVSLSQHSEMGEQPMSKVVFSVSGQEVRSESNGNGPVDATVKAIEQEVKSGAELLLFSVNAITTGTESQGEVTMRLRSSPRPGLSGCRKSSKIKRFQSHGAPGRRVRKFNPLLKGFLP